MRVAWSSLASALPNLDCISAVRAFDRRDIGLQPFDCSPARPAAQSQVEHESRIADRAPAKTSRGNMIIFQMLFNPFKQGHVLFAPTRKSLVFLFCSY